MLTRIVDLAFPIQGDRIPADHGYALYAAVSQVQTSLHRAPWLGVHPIKGIAAGANLVLPLGTPAFGSVPLRSHRFGRPSRCIRDSSSSRGSWIGMPLGRPSRDSWTRWE